MRGVNKVIIVGNVVKDPELKQTTGGTDVCKLSIATNRRWKGQDGQYQEEVEFHNIVLWSGLAKTAATYLKKGNPVYIEGRITTRKYNKDGVDKYITEIVANELLLLPSGSKSETQPSAPAVTVKAEEIVPPAPDMDEAFDM